MAAGSEPVAGAGAAVDLSAVAEPPDVVAVLRWKNPNAAFSTFSQWFGLPVPIDEAVEEVLRVPGASTVVNADSQVELVVALDPKASERNPKPFVAVSVGMRSVQDARQVFARDREVREVQDGVYQVELGSRYDAITCFLGPSLGSSPARMVCGPRERDVDALYPYMTRGLPTLPASESDLNGELRFGPIQQRYGAMLPSALQMGASFVSHEVATGDRALDRAITDAVAGLSDELLALVNDVDKLTIDVSLQPGGKMVRGGMSLQFKHRNSWLSQRMFDNASKAGPAPEIFWLAPSSADSAFFARGADAKVYEGIRRAGANLIDAGLANQGLGAGDRKVLVDLQQRLFESSPISVSASGHVDPAAISSAGAQSADEIERVRQAVTASLGWHLVGLEEPSTRFDAWLRDFAAAYRRPSVQQWLRKVASVDARSMPTVQYRPSNVAGLRGLKALEISVPAALIDPSAKGTQNPLVFSILLLPDGNRTWLAVGAHPKTLTDVLSSVRAAGAKSLASKPGLEPLKTSRTVTGGYITIAAIASRAATSIADAFRGSHRNRDLEQALDALAKMPHHGETPIVVTSTVNEGNPARASVQFEVPQGTIDDLRALLMLMGGKRRP